MTDGHSSHGTHAQHSTPHGRTVEYSIPRPSVPVSLWLLGLLILVGLTALSIAAYHAFELVAPTFQAVAAAGVMEIGLIVEALAVMRGNKWARVGVGVSLTVSGIYNYVQAEAAGKAAGLTNIVELVALAVGPLSALFFAAMTAGGELRKYEQAVEEWEKARQAWLDDLAEKERQSEEKRQAAEQQQRQAELYIERQRIQAEQAAKLEAERMRLEAESKLALQQQRLQLSEQRRKERQAAKDERKDAGKLPEIHTVLPESAGKVTDWRQLSTEEKDALSGKTVSEIVELYPINERTARLWKKRIAKNGYHKEGVR